MSTNCMNHDLYPALLYSAANGDKNTKHAMIVDMQNGSIALFPGSPLALTKNGARGLEPGN